MKRGASKSLLSFLAAYDLCTGTMVLPMRIASLLADPMESHWPLQKVSAVMRAVLASDFADGDGNNSYLPHTLYYSLFYG